MTTKDIRNAIVLIESLQNEGALIEIDTHEYEQIIIDTFGYDTIMKYTSGLCHVLAFALHDALPNSDIVVIYDYDCDIESPVITHVVTKFENYFIDINNVTANIQHIVDNYEDHGDQNIVINNDRESIVELAGEYSKKDYDDAEVVAKKIVETLRGYNGNKD